MRRLLQFRKSPIRVFDCLARSAARFSTVDLADVAKNPSKYELIVSGAGQETANGTYHPKRSGMWGMGKPWWSKDADAFVGWGEDTCMWWIHVPGMGFQGGGTSAGAQGYKDVSTGAYLSFRRLLMIERTCFFLT